MIAQSAGLSAEEGRAIAHYVTGKEFSASVVTNVARCSGNPPPIRITDMGWNGWGDDVANTRYQPKPGLTAADVPKLKVKWAFGFAGETVRSAQPTIVGGRVFVGSSSGAIYSLDASTGCIYWNYDAGATVRTAVSSRQARGQRQLRRLFWRHPILRPCRGCRDGKGSVEGQGGGSSGFASHGSAHFLQRTVICSGVVDRRGIGHARRITSAASFAGSVVALDGATGKQIWKSYSVPDPPQETKPSANGTKQWGPAGAAIWSAPTIDAKNKVIYAATGNSYTNVSINTSNAILAFDLETGSLKWSSQVLPKDNFTMGCGRGVNCPEDRGTGFRLRHFAGRCANYLTASGC